jgi:uncharacterized protein YciI
MIYIVLLTYPASMDEIDSRTAAHRAYLDRYQREGVFVLAGPQVPRHGGVIMARGVDRKRLEEILDEDPFTPVLFERRVIEMRPTRGSEVTLASLVEPES